MNRKKFIKSILVSGTGVGFAPLIFQGATKTSSTSTNLSADKSPKKNINKMKNVIHRAESRGHANHGWLNSFHTFSFANYYNPERMNFGVLRVLNDDMVSESQGFGTHPHRDMEIISLPLEGDLKHKDNMGNETIIREGDIQVMSAGTGVMHSEYNNNPDKAVKFLQIWVVPNTQNVTPRYDQISLADIAKENQFYQVLSPNKEDEGVWIYQDAWFHMGKFTKGNSDEYAIKKAGNGVYVFVLEGEVEINGQKLSRRDGMGIWDTDKFSLTASEDAKVLLMEVPMDL